jgi:hypothetical protein
MSPPYPRNKIKKNKEIWILFSISLMKIKLHFEIRKTTRTRTTKRPHLKMFNIRAIEHKILSKHKSSLILDKIK